MPNPFNPVGTNDSVSFIGDTREIVVGAASTAFNIQFVYSFWKQWVREGNAQYLPAFRPVGGDDLGADNRIAFYAFLANNWRVRVPLELDDLLVTGGVLLTEELDNPFRFDGVLITIQAPIAVQALESVKSDTIINNIAATRSDVQQNRNVLENVVAPEIYYTRNTVEKTLAPAALNVLSPVSNVTYENTTGIVTVTTGIQTHNLSVGDRVHISGIAMTCLEDAGQTTVLFPDIEIGSGTYPNAADISQPYVFDIVDVPADNQLVIQTGISSFTHFYSYGGVVSRMAIDLIANQVNVGINTIQPLTSAETMIDKIEKIKKNASLIAALL
jgi:hypothetical protein